jgi:hypothetical protein
MKINSEDYEAGEALTTKEAIKWMADGNVAISENVKGTVYHFDDDNGFGWADKNGAFGFGVHFTSVVEPVWRKAILKRKPISWEDAVRAMLDGKHVWDRVGNEWSCFGYGFAVVNERGGKTIGADLREFFAPFYLTQPPSSESDHKLDAVPYLSGPPKPERRKASREDAICAMVRDPGQHCWATLQHEDREIEYRWDNENAQVLMLCWANNCKWMKCSVNKQATFYLDPPEAK